MLMQTDEVQDDELIASTGLEDLSNCPLDSLKDEILVITFNEPIQDPFGHLRATTQNYVGSISPNQFAIVDESHQTCQLKQMENNTEGVKTSYIKVDSLPKLIVNLLNASSSMKAQDDIVIAVRLLNLILVALELDSKSFRTDPSDFEDIYDVGHSIDFLKVEVYIIRRLPKRFSGKYGFEALEMPLVSWANEKYCIEQILLLFSKHKVVHFNRIYTRLVNNGNPLDLQKLRCSGPFFLVPPSGSMTVFVPKPSSNAMFILPVTSNVIAAAYVGRIHAIIFQSRYVISNTGVKDLYYKQKIDILYYLSVGQHSQLQWTDATSEERPATLKATFSQNRLSQMGVLDFIDTSTQFSTWYELISTSQGLNLDGPKLFIERITMNGAIKINLSQCLGRVLNEATMIKSGYFYISNFHISSEMHQIGFCP
ncbi:hypothetical protein V6N11_043171 [Hibiscus sabdariffa]|uniref:O-fucosyltransferase family protein n=1 Tax=Hibiscus sabdariffa TaxID=183260 RepID=A0ABR2QYX5_9ROSI